MGASAESDEFCWMQRDVILVSSGHHFFGKIQPLVLAIEVVNRYSVPYNYYYLSRLVQYCYKLGVRNLLAAILSYQY